MIANFVKNRIISQLPFVPNAGQEEAIEQLACFLSERTERPCFLLMGYAGTGKTSLVSALTKAMVNLQMPTVLLAPTGRAAKVMSHYSGTGAYTIHKCIYMVNRVPPGTPIEGKSVNRGVGESANWDLRFNKDKNVLFIVDEASMISEDLLTDLIQYVYQGENCRLLLLGDDAQLPPVECENSPALQEDKLARYGLTIHLACLTEVARQTDGSGVLKDATRVRSCIIRPSVDRRQDHGKPIENQHDKKHENKYDNQQGIQYDNQYDNQQGNQQENQQGISQGNSQGIFDLISPYEDVLLLPPNKMVEEIERSYDEVGVEETLIVTRSNKRTNLYNQGVRAQLLWKEDILQTGDRIMVSRNNYFFSQQYEGLPFLANGDMMEVVRLRNERELYGCRFADASLKSLDYEWEIDAVIWLDTLLADTPEDNYAKQRELYMHIAEDYPEIRSKKELREKIFASPYFNALQIRYAYSVTCHKAQGGQWKRVFIDPGALGMAEQVLTTEDYRWLYTAITRATEKVYLLKSK
ncbi:MAG: AAA family ATPase [Paludibacteraceae bacterium]|nr:AAA family ATPase [Paludibacteraceae bacterium]